MKANYYEVSIVAMDNECNNSVKYIDIDVLGTFKCAKQVCKHTIEELEAGYYNHQLRGVQYCYITIMPYSDDHQCLLGFAEDYHTAYYHRIGDNWKKVAE